MCTTSLYADLKSHISETVAEANRSLLDPYIKQMTLEWIDRTVLGKTELFKKVVASRMKEDGVKVRVPDFLADDKVEFSWVLSMVYCINVAEKSHGSRWPKSRWRSSRTGRQTRR